MNPSAAPHTASLDETTEATEEYTLPCAEAMLAGTLALMTGYGQSPSNCPNRPLLAAKLVSNLIRLSHNPVFTAPMRVMLANLTTRWQIEVENACAQNAPAQPKVLWHNTPGGLQ